MKLPQKESERPTPRQSTILSIASSKNGGKAINGVKNFMNYLELIAFFGALSCDLQKRSASTSPKLKPSIWRMPSSISANGQGERLLSDGFVIWLWVVNQLQMTGPPLNSFFGWLFFPREWIWLRSHLGRHIVVRDNSAKRRKEISLIS